MKLLTKVARGVAYGDVSNQAVRNILTEISKRIGGVMTESEMSETMDFFGWKCPYTGRDLRASIENRDGSYATDHIYPQNKEWCGLNVKGNLVIVDKLANEAKGNKDVETFLLNDKKFFGNLDKTIRDARLERIKEFQKACGYDPYLIRNVIGKRLQDRYDEIRVEQEQYIDDNIKDLINNNVKVLPKSKSILPTIGKQGAKNKISTELVFYPSNEVQFKDELLKKKKAHFVLTYQDGIIKTSQWNVKDFDEKSKLRNNIQSKLFWRHRQSEGLVKVEVYVD